MLIKHIATDSHVVGIDHAGAITHYEFGPEQVRDDVKPEDTADILALDCFEEVNERTDKETDSTKTESVFGCPDCEKTFKTEAALKGHSQVHKKDVPADETPAAA